MTDTPSRRRSCMNRTERAEHLYTARANEYPLESNEAAYRPNEPDDAVYQPNDETVYASYLPNEPADEDAQYLPNEPQEEYGGYTPNEEPDYAAYYSREGAEQEKEAEPAFAPPPSMRQYAFEHQTWEEEEPEDAYTAGNVYRPRQVTWAEEEREQAIAQSDLGYQVQEDAKPVRCRKRHTLRNVLIVLLVLALLLGAAWLMRDRLAEMFGITVFTTLPTETPAAAITTPEPVRAYDAAPVAAVSDTARSSIARLSGTLEMDNYIVTDQHIVTRNQRADGRYDFYLFTAEGRLLCYFEGLEALDMIPQAFGGFYVQQAPWLVTAGGSALIRTADVEAAINESVFLHPMYHGWAVVESEADGHANYVNAEGKLMSSLWFSRTFAFTGTHTLAYVDTGSMGENDRYLLYVIGEDGRMTRWLSAGDMEDAVAAVCGMAYMKDGSVYHLPDTAQPICQSPEVTAYLDCDAMVVRHPETGKYGLFVHGEQHYDYAYDAIHPLKSDLAWDEKTMGRSGALLTLKAVSNAVYPQPLSYSFVLEKDGESEYVALSASSSYPIRLDGEF